MIETITPWKHQTEAIERAVKVKNFGLFHEMGVGKTFTAIQILRWWCTHHRRQLKTLVLAPPVVITNWQREIKKFSRMGDAVVCLTGSGKDRLKQLKAVGATERILVTNYETLLMDPVFEALMEYRPEVLIADESHRCKNHKVTRTKKTIKLADQTKYRLILTGTPILNSALDLFAQFRILDGGALFGRSHSIFRATYFKDLNEHMPSAKRFPNWVVKPGSLDLLNGKIKPISMSVKKEDCLDLPPFVRQTVFVELSREQARLYKSMKNEFIAYMNDKACIATLAITKALRLQQIVSGHIALEDEGGTRSTVQIKDNPRAKALEELLSDIAGGSKVLVWVQFRAGYAVIRKVCEGLGLPFVEVHGEVPTSARQKNIDAFNSDPAVRVLIGHPGSGGIGVNLVAASYSIFYSRGFSLEHDLQAEARNYRSGSEIHAKITRIDLVAKDTIDELIAESLDRKQEIGDKVLRSIAEKI